MSAVSGTWSVTISLSRSSSSRGTDSTEVVRQRSLARTRQPNPRSLSSTATPMRPVPMTPMVMSRSSFPGWSLIR